MSPALKTALTKVWVLRASPRALAKVPVARFLATGGAPGKLRTPSIDEQAQPLGSYYESILNTPTPYPTVKPEDPPSSSAVVEPPDPAPTKPRRGRKPKATKTSSAETLRTASSSPSQETSPPAPSPPPTSAESKAKIVFGSRLVGPAERAERLAAVRAQSTLIAGVLVPPKPEEPDNCCMSGCVNCVWDRFREEMEHWAASSAEAKRRLMVQEAGLGGATSQAEVQGRGVTTATDGVVAPDRVGVVSMDDDGGGSETNWDMEHATGRSPKIAKNLWDEELYQNVPVGIREFMKQEKRLKEKHMREGTSGG